MHMRIFVLASLVLLMVSCGEISYGNIPEKTVNFTVRPRSLDNTLMPVGSFKYFPYGYSGVVVYHIGDMDEEYVAFEQACPLDWEAGCFVKFDKDNFVLKGEQCHLTYSSYSGYGRDKGNARYALRKYHITYLSSQGEFQVSN